MTDALMQIGGKLLQPIIDPASRTFGPYLLIAAVIALVLHRWRRSNGSVSEALGLQLWTQPSSVLDLQILITRRLLGIIGLIPAAGGAWLLAVKVATTLDHSFGVPQVPVIPQWLLTVGYTLVLFVAWDLSRFILHMLMHRVPFLWQFHQVHHSAEVLTPLTFHRVHPVESIFYSLRSVGTTGIMAGVTFWIFRGSAVEFTLLGVHGIGLILNAVSGNLRHSHVWLRFGPKIEQWLLSPAQHQLHHINEPAYFNCNYGTWLALWDRVLNTLIVAPEKRSGTVGLSKPNHDPRNLVSAITAPLLSALRVISIPIPMSLIRLLAATTLLLPSIAHADDAKASESEAQENDEDPDEDPDEDSDGSMFVYGSRGAPRVAGSAHVISEEELERHEYTDIHQILSTVPGVYLRGEDGFGLRPNIGMRGGNSDRSAKITLLEDGVPLVPAPYAAPAAYYFPMPMRLVGVEVIKGAAAIRHGPQTIGGAVNLITRKVPQETVAAIDSAYGMRNTIKTHGYTGTGNDRWGVLAEIAHMSSDGFKELDGGGPTGFQRQDAMIKARLGTDTSNDVFNDVEIKLGYGREVSDETYLGLTGTDFDASPNRRYAASSGDQMQWNRKQGSLTWKLLAGQNFDARTVVYTNRLERAWTKLNGFSDGTSIHDLLLTEPTGGQAEAYLAILKGEEDNSNFDQQLLRGTNDRRFKSSGVQTVTHWRIGSDKIENELELGIRFHHDDVVRHHTEQAHDMRAGRLVQTDEETTTILDSHNNASALAVHLHDELTLGRTHLLPGVRTERITTAAGNRETGPEDPRTYTVVLPGLGAYVEATESVIVLAGANRGFSPISPGSPEETVPETAWNYEAGVRYAHAHTMAELIGFYSDYENMTGQCTLSGGCTDAQLDTQYNGGQATVRGIESTLGQDFDLASEFSLNLDVTYSWTDAHFESSFLSGFPQYGLVESGDFLPYVPVHQGGGSIALQHEKGHVSIKGTGRSGMRNEAGADESEEAIPIPSSLTMDIASEYRFNPHWALYTSATNVTGQRTIESWRPFGARPNAPTQVMVGIKAKL
jgi:Fe(3+) dicitrate transport protein